jgi:hypothetical protein
MAGDDHSSAFLFESSENIMTLLLENNITHSQDFIDKDYRSR